MQYTLADLSIDLDARRVHRDQDELNVQGLSFDLLAYLLKQGERVVAVDELIDAIWAPAVVNEETVTQRVKLLRQALSDDSRHPRYLRTVRGSGYQLCAPAVLQPTNTAPVDVARGSPGRLLGPMLAVGLLLVGALWWVKSPLGIDNEPAIADNATQAILARAQHYAAIGQRDDTLRAIDLYQQALALQPDSAVAKLGLSFASSAMMCLHNDAKERALEAHRLAEELIAANPEHAAAYAARAYAADCRGLIERAIADYGRAIQLDPRGRLDALASRAHLQAIRGDLAAALAANLKARAGGHDLRLVDLQLAHNLELLGYAAAAERLLRRSFQLHPDSAFIAAAWPGYLYRQGRIQQARAALAEAQGRPQHPTLWLLAAEMALLDGDTMAAVDAYQKAIALKPDSGPAETLLRIHAGDLEPQWAGARLDQLHQAIDEGDRWPDNWLEIAQLQLALGDPDAALDALQQARQAGYRDRAQLTLSPLWRSLRDHPGFAQLLEAIATAIAAEREQAREAPGLAELLGEGVR